MNIEPRYQEDYGSRQVEAAYRVLVDLGQVLASFADCFVVIGGWIPDLLLDTSQTEPHIGSIDVDLALDVNKLSGERYAELLQSLLSTRRYPLPAPYVRNHAGPCGRNTAGRPKTHEAQ